MAQQGNVTRPQKQHRQLSRFAAPHRTTCVGVSSAADSVSLYIPRDLLERVFRAGLEQAGVETGGYLFGQVHLDGDQAIVRAVGSCPVVPRETGPSQFAFRAEDGAAAARYRRRHHPDAEIVGWYHARPGRGVFMSSVDEAAGEQHLRAQPRVALVVDPVQRKFGALAQDRDRFYSLSHIHVIETKEADPPREAQSQPAPSLDQPKPLRGPDTPGSRRLETLLAAALTAIIVLFLLWCGYLNARTNDRIDRIRAELPQAAGQAGSAQETAEGPERHVRERLAALEACAPRLEKSHDELRERVGQLGEELQAALDAVRRELAVTNRHLQTLLEQPPPTEGRREHGGDPRPAGAGSGR